MTSKEINEKLLKGVLLVLFNKTHYWIAILFSSTSACSYTKLFLTVPSSLLIHAVLFFSVGLNNNNNIFFMCVCVCVCVCVCINLFI